MPKKMDVAVDRQREKRKDTSLLDGRKSVIRENRQTRRRVKGESKVSGDVLAKEDVSNPLRKGSAREEMNNGFYSFWPSPVIFRLQCEAGGGTVGVSKKFSAYFDCWSSFKVCFLGVEGEKRERG